MSASCLPGDPVPFGDRRGELPSYLVARVVKPASLSERQEARRERLRAAGLCSPGRDPIDVELAEMLRAGR